jgi:WD40 repeat protein
MGDNQTYPDDHIDKPIEDSKISRRNIRFNGVMSRQSTKRYNIHFLEDNLIIYVLGNKYQTYDLDTKEKRTYDGLDTDGVGSICVHSTRRYFAVAEKGNMPNIYIRQYPGFKTYRILRRGTEKAYAHVEFSTSGNMLVSLGQAPDFTLTVWDWRKERVILKCKAYGQDVYRSSFSPFSDDVLFTGGSGHIKFWKMA